jgi:hypothetical protein
MRYRTQSPETDVQAAQCKQRAAACTREALRLDDDMLQEAYIQLARLWRASAERTFSLNQAENKADGSRQYVTKQ